MTTTAVSALAPLTRAERTNLYDFLRQAEATAQGAERMITHLLPKSVTHPDFDALLKLQMDQLGMQSELNSIMVDILRLGSDVTAI